MPTAARRTRHRRGWPQAAAAPLDAAADALDDGPSARAQVDRSGSSRGEAANRLVAAGHGDRRRSRTAGGSTRAPRHGATSRPVLATGTGHAGALPAAIRSLFTVARDQIPPRNDPTTPTADGLRTGVRGLARQPPTACAPSAPRRRGGGAAGEQTEGALGESLEILRRRRPSRRADHGQASRTTARPRRRGAASSQRWRQVTSDPAATSSSAPRSTGAGRIGASSRRPLAQLPPVIQARPPASGPALLRGLPPGTLRRAAPVIRPERRGRAARATRRAAPTSGHLEHAARPRRPARSGRRPTTRKRGCRCGRDEPERGSGHRDHPRAGAPAARCRAARRSRPPPGRR